MTNNYFKSTNTATAQYKICNFEGRNQFCRQKKMATIENKINLPLRNLQLMSHQSLHSAAHDKKILVSNFAARYMR